MEKMTWLIGGIALYLIMTVVIDIYGEGRDLNQQDHMHSEVGAYLHKETSAPRTDEIKDSAPAVSQAKHLSGAMQANGSTGAKDNSVVNDSSEGSADSITGRTGWYLPLDNKVYITSDYGGRNYFHSGVDLGIGGNPDNIEVKAVASGTVSKVAFMQLSGSGPTGYGYYIQLTHDVSGEKHYSIYGHLKSLPKFKVGDTVSEGQVVGIMGKTGCGSCNRHLHLEIGYDDDASRTKYKTRNESQYIKKASNAWWWAKSTNWVRSNPKDYFTELKGKGSGAIVIRTSKSQPIGSGGATPKTN